MTCSVFGELADVLGSFTITSPLVDNDPVRAPEALPTGRNMYGFDPSRGLRPEKWSSLKYGF